MKTRFPLYAQILGFLLLHLFLLLAIFFAFFNSEFGPGLQALVEGPIGDQMDAVAWSIRKQTESLPATSWDSVLRDFGKIYRMKFYIFDGNGQQLAGDPVTLPPQVRERVVMQVPMPPMMGMFGHHGPIFFNTMSPAEMFRHEPHLTSEGFAPADTPPDGFVRNLPGPPHEFEHGLGPQDDQFQPKFEPLPVQSFQSHDPNKPAFGPINTNTLFISAAEPATATTRKYSIAFAPISPSRIGTRSLFTAASPVAMALQANPARTRILPELEFKSRTMLQPQFGARANSDNAHIHGLGGEHNFLIAPQFAYRVGEGNSRRFHPMPPLPAPTGRRFMLHTTNPNGYWIGTTFPVPTPFKRMPTDSLRAATAFKPGKALRFGVLMASTPNLWQSKLFLDVGFVLCMIAIAVGMSILIWLPFALRLTRKLGELSSATEKIAQGNFDIRLVGGDFDEINGLASTVNTLGERLNNFVIGQKRFLGDIAHELCSPIARLQMALAVLEQTDDGKHQQVISDIREEVEDMSALIQELLSFSKASLVGTDLELVSVTVKPLLDEVVAKADAHQIIELSVVDGLCVTVEPTLFKRAVSNVVRNAVRYAGQSGPITVAAVRDGDFATVTITDSGPGVPAEALKLLGEPFFRPEPSRDRTSGGVGLGLAIVKTCIERCNGTFQVENRPTGGLLVRLRVPAVAQNTSENGKREYSGNVSAAGTANIENAPAETDSSSTSSSKGKTSTTDAANGVSV